MKGSVTSLLPPYSTCDKWDFASSSHFTMGKEGPQPR